MRMLSQPPPGCVGALLRAAYCNSPPGWNPVQMISPFLVFTSAKTILTVSTWAAVRQPSDSSPLHCTDAGSKWHLVGSPMRPSLTPSSASHLARIALCSISTLTCERAPFGFFIISMDRSTPAACRWICGLAGAPASTPSKSSGNLVTSTSAWRPPVEQPFQYEYLELAP